MSIMNITNIQVKNPKASISSPLQFQITFECLQQISQEIEWSITYVGSASSTNHDQILEAFSMGPLQAGTMQFDLEVAPPQLELIPKDDLIGITALIISVSYLKSEFFRAGYYICNQYEEEQEDEQQQDITRLQRTILSDKPRITRFEIDYGQEQIQENASVQQSVITYQQESQTHSITQSESESESKNNEQLQVNSNWNIQKIMGEYQQIDPFINSDNNLSKLFNLKSNSQFLSSFENKENLSSQNIF